MSALSQHIESTDSMIEKFTTVNLLYFLAILSARTFSPISRRAQTTLCQAGTFNFAQVNSIVLLQYSVTLMSLRRTFSVVSSTPSKDQECAILQLPKNILHISFVCWQYGYSIVASISTLSQISNLISVCHNSLLRVPLLSYVRPLRNLHTNLNMPWGLTFLFITGTFCTRNGYQYILLWRLPAKWKRKLDTFINYIHKFG